MVCLKGEIVITIRPYDTLYLLRSETHLNKDCTVGGATACEFEMG